LRISVISAIRILNFTEKKEEWSTRNERFLVKARRSGIKNIFFGQVTILKTSKEINEKTDQGKSKLKISDLSKLARTEFILSIDVRTNGGKVAFNMAESCKNRDYKKVNAAIS
jgi:hypothetical protein